MASKSEEQRRAEEAASKRHARLDNAGVLSMSAAAGAMDKITILPGHEPDYSACTFCLWEEDHTLGNALRWVIMKDPNVEYCGYSAPHPSDPKIHLRIQMYDGLSAVDCLRSALGNLRDLFLAVDDKYKRSLRKDKYVREEDVDVHQVVADELRARGLPVQEGEDKMDVSA